MKEYTSENIRNIALAGHSGSGKTTLTEAILYYLKYTDRLGRVDAGNTVSDYDPEEISRKVSINASLLSLEYKGHKINLLDLPGYRDFVNEIKNGIRVADTVLIVLDAVSGVEVGAEFVWEYAEEYDIPRAFFINKLDKEHADFESVLAGIKEEFGKNAVPLTLPIGKEASFSGVIDLIRMKKVVESREKVSYEPIPEEQKEQAEQWRQVLIEAAAEGDDELTMKYLEDQPLTDEEILRGIKEGMRDRRFVPVLCGSAYNCLGIYPLLDFILNCVPSPLEMPGFVNVEDSSKKVAEYDPQKPFSAYVFKTVSDPYAGRLSFFKVITGEIMADSIVFNVNKNKEEKISHLLSIRGKKQENVHKLSTGDIGAVAKLSATATADTLVAPGNTVKYAPTKLPAYTCQMALVTDSKTAEEKIGMAMHRLTEQDPTLQIWRDHEVRQTIIAGMGDTHLDVALSRLRTFANVEIRMETPRVPYKETITKTAKGQGKYKRQSGGRGQYGDVWLELSPLPRGEGFQFEWKIVGGVIPSKYQPSIEKGIREAMEKGIIAGYPVVDVKAVCYDGSHHSVDSSDIAFKIAGSMAFRNVAQQANPIVLEPIMNLKVIAPESNMGDILGNLSGKRGRILGQELKGNKVIIHAQVPLGEMFEYSRELRSMTQGRGTYEMEFSHYEPVPPQLQEKIIAEAEQRKAQEE
ncbi:elongation factor G [Candidatus Sumerlaeota bacterium]|nr:elongation factor G [Candidatus Sumerlaeota bacterium]